jgi:hypothetical protein
MTIEIMLADAVPQHLQDTLQRCGFLVIPIGGALRVQVGERLLSGQEAIVRVRAESAFPGATLAFQMDQK